MAAIDRLSPLLARFPARAELFHSGRLCGAAVFEARPGRGFMHVLRRGRVRIEHAARTGLPAVLEVDEPSVLFYPRAVSHRFRNPPQDGSDFVCASVHFAEGDNHPLARCLPPLVVLALHSSPQLAQTLDLLAAETAEPRCASHLIADRLFEVALLQLLRHLLDDGSADRGLVAGLADARLARALTAVHAAPGDSWTVERMAGAAGMSRSAFARHFAQIVGQPPLDYLTGWRLAQAATMLRAGQGLGMIALRLGYSGHAALSRAFSQRMGLSPREWLRQNGDAARERPP